MEPRVEGAELLDVLGRAAQRHPAALLRGDERLPLLGAQPAFGDDPGGRSVEDEPEPHRIVEFAEVDPGIPIRDRQPRDEGAAVASPADADDPGGLKLAERLAQRRPGDVDPRGELTLGRQLVADEVLAEADRAEELGDRVLEDVAAAQSGRTLGLRSLLGDRSLLSGTWAVSDIRGAAGLAAHAA